jgi:hypothetical protein
MILKEIPYVAAHVGMAGLTIGSHAFFKQNKDVCFSTLFRFAVAANEIIVCYASAVLAKHYELSHRNLHILGVGLRAITGSLLLGTVSMMCPALRKELSITLLTLLAFRIASIGMGFLSKIASQDQLPASIWDFRYFSNPFFEKKETENLFENFTFLQDRIFALIDKENDILDNELDEHPCYRNFKVKKEKVDTFYLLLSQQFSEIQKSTEPNTERLASHYKATALDLEKHLVELEALVFEINPSTL